MLEEKYRWASPYAWFGWRLHKAKKENDVAWVFAYLHMLAVHTDADTMENVFGEDMKNTGYYLPEDNKKGQLDENSSQWQGRCRQDDLFRSFDSNA